MRIALHHTAVRRTGSQLLAVDRYHKDKWNMKSSLGWYVAYNVFCDHDGGITQTRAVGTETVANIGHNCTSGVPDIGDCDIISFCFAGDFNHELPSDAQIKGFQKWKEDYDMELTTHRDIQTNRTCPGVLMTDEYIATRLGGKKQYPDPEDLSKEQINSFVKQLDGIRAALRRLLSLIKT